jgi:hypothetical protein
MLFQIGLLLVVSGCVPGVAWRPDSSGFVYTDREGKRLLDFDLKTKKSSVLVADTGTATAWPAMSPDGKQLAVARAEERKGLPRRVQVARYSSEGKLVGRSPWFELSGDPGKNNKVDATFLHWAAADRILVIAEATAIYDVAKDRLIEVPEVAPWVAGMWGLRPDGKGFLAYDESGEDVKLFFVGWDGKKQAIKGGWPKKEEYLLVGWEKNTAILRSGDRMAEADLDKLTLAESKRKPVAFLEAEGERSGYWLFPGKQMAVCVYTKMEKTPKGSRKYQRIEVEDLAGKNRRVVVPKGEVFSVFAPSPDRKHVAIYYSLADKGGGKILVVSSAGDVATEVSLEP